MALKVHHLRPAPGAKTAKTRVGRGEGGKRGKTAGRGTKGTGARKNTPENFEGGQMPMHMRVPKLRRSGGLTGGPFFSVQLKWSRCFSSSIVQAISTRPAGTESAPNFVVLVQSSLNVIASAMTAPEVIRISGPLKWNRLAP